VRARKSESEKERVRARKKERATKRESETEREGHGRGCFGGRAGSRESEKVPDLQIYTLTHIHTQRARHESGCA